MYSTLLRKAFGNPHRQISLQTVHIYPPLICIFQGSTYVHTSTITLQRELAPQNVPVCSNGRCTRTVFNTYSVLLFSLIHRFTCLWFCNPFPLCMSTFILYSILLVPSGNHSAQCTVCTSIGPIRPVKSGSSTAC